MSWQIRIPLRARSDDLSDLARNARTLESAEDRALVHELATVGVLCGFRRAEELVWGLQEMSEGERRKAFNALRRRVGLPTAETAEAHSEFEQANRVVLVQGPRTVAYRLSKTGAIIEDDPVEQAREAADDDRRRRMLEDDVAERARESQQRAEADRARAAQRAAELPAGLRPRERSS